MVIKKVFVYFGTTMYILLAVLDYVSQVWSYYSTALQGQNSFPSKRFKVTRNRSFKGGRLLLRNGDCCGQLPMHLVTLFNKNWGGLVEKDGFFVIYLLDRYVLVYS